MLIGLTVLAACILLSRAVLAVSGAGNFSRFTEEGFIILRWVANWKPIEIFLYEWLPLARRRDLYRSLAVANVELRPTEPDREGMIVWDHAQAPSNHGTARPTDFQSHSARDDVSQPGRQ